MFPLDDFLAMMSKMFQLKEYLNSKSRIVEQALGELFVKGISVELVSAMNYSLKAGGKRIRPILVMASRDMLLKEDVKKATEYQKVMPLACAIEMIHTYSLIHDDLPAMDNDDLRRGKPTSHKVYGEAVAILAGDALLTEAFNVLCLLSKNHEHDKVIELIKYVSKASGMNGMVGGQVLDIENDGVHVKPDLEYLYKTSYCKTGELIKASVAGPAILYGTISDTKCLEEYGKAIGIAFQMVDDVLGVTSTKEELGKSAHIDEKNNKRTFIDILGVDGTKKLALQEIEKAKTAIAPYGKFAEPLLSIAEYIISRTH